MIRSLVVGGCSVNSLTIINHEQEKQRLAFLDARAHPGLVETGRFDVVGLLGGVRAVSGNLD